MSFLHFIFSNRKGKEEEFRPGIKTGGSLFLVVFMNMLGKRKQFRGSCSPSKRLKTSDGSITVKDVAVGETDQGVFILKLISDELIRSKCSKEVYEQAHTYIDSVTDLLLCNTEQSRVNIVVRLSGVVLGRFNNSICLRNRNESFIDRAEIISAKCSCDSLSSHQLCVHTIAVLLAVFKKGVRIVELYKDLNQLIASQSNEVCIFYFLFFFLFKMRVLILFSFFLF